MKVVSAQKRGNRAKTLVQTANVHDNAAFPSIGLAVSGNRGKRAGSQVSTAIVVPEILLMHDVFYLG